LFDSSCNFSFPGYKDNPLFINKEVPARSFTFIHDAEKVRALSLLLLIYNFLAVFLIILKGLFFSDRGNAVTLKTPNASLRREKRKVRE
jgi:hypothetical protein